MRNVIAFLFCFVSLYGYSQYWFGPKLGINRSDFIYQRETVKDSFDISATFNFEAGGVFVYQASPMFSVQAELYYEQVKKKMDGKLTLGDSIASRATNRFISTPFLFRVSLGSRPVHYYVSGGVKLRYWLGGKGKFQYGELEFGEQPNIYDKIVFKQSKSNTDARVYAVPDANIVQYGLIAGAGFYIDLATNARLLVDAKYYFGHSNMGFDNNPDFFITPTTSKDYQDSFAYRNHTFSISIAYLFHYDVHQNREGASTSKVDKGASKDKEK